MDEVTKQVLNDSPYEVWTEQKPIDQGDDQEVKVDPKRVKKSLQVITELNKRSRMRDCLNYDAMVANRPSFPPGHSKTSPRILTQHTTSC